MITWLVTDDTILKKESTFDFTKLIDSISLLIFCLKFSLLNPIASVANKLQ